MLSGWSDLRSDNLPNTAYLVDSIPHLWLFPRVAAIVHHGGAGTTAAAACIFFLVTSLLKWHQPGAVYLLVGSLLYLIGTFGVTMIFNVPLNEALATVDPSSADGLKLWSSYLVNWTLWNHVRTAFSLAATVFFTIGFCYRAA